MRATGRHIMKSTSVSGEIYSMDHADGSQSDTALGSLGLGIKKRRSSLSQRVVAILPSRRSRSTSQLSQTGQKNSLFQLCEEHQVQFALRRGDFMLTDDDAVGPPCQTQTNLFELEPLFVKKYILQNDKSFVSFDHKPSLDQLKAA